MRHDGSMISQFWQLGCALHLSLKTIFSLAACLVSLAGFCAEPAEKLDGFAGIPFGSSAEQVKAAMNARGARLNDTKSTSAHMEFQGGVLGKEDVLFWAFYFVDGKFFKGNARINSPFAQRFAKYDELKKLISDKYGAPTEEKTDTGSSPQSSDENAPNDGSDLYKAVRAGKASVKAKWVTDSGSITCEILKRYDAVWIILTYEDKALSKVFSDKRLKDY